MIVVLWLLSVPATISANGGDIFAIVMEVLAYVESHGNRVFLVSCDISYVSVDNLIAFFDKFPRKKTRHFSIC